MFMFINFFQFINFLIHNRCEFCDRNNSLILGHILILLLTSHYFYFYRITTIKCAIFLFHSQEANKVFIYHPYISSSNVRQTHSKMFFLSSKNLFQDFFCLNYRKLIKEFIVFIIFDLMWSTLSQIPFKYFIRFNLGYILNFGDVNLDKRVNLIGF